MKKKLLGNIINYYPKIQVVIIELIVPLAINDTVHFIGETVDFIQKVDSMEVNREKINQAEIGTIIGLKVNKSVNKQCQVYKIS